MRNDISKNDDKINGKDVNEAFLNISEEDLWTLSNIAERLAELRKGKWPDDPIQDKEIKKEIALISLKLIKGTPNDKKSVMETCYVITASFDDYVYGDELDDAINIAEDLEVPQKYVYNDVFDMFEKMKSIFEKYLEKHQT